jgi:Glyoxalase-like domain
MKAQVATLPDLTDAAALGWHEAYADTIGRLVALGASPIDVGQPADAPWVVLADPEGNELCVQPADM